MERIDDIEKSIDKNDYDETKAKIDSVWEKLKEKERTV